MRRFDLAAVIRPLRHCEQSEAIQKEQRPLTSCSKNWIATRRFAARDDAGGRSSFKRPALSSRCGASTLQRSSAPCVIASKAKQSRKNNALSHHAAKTGSPRGVSPLAMTQGEGGLLLSDRPTGLTLISHATGQQALRLFVSSDRPTGLTLNPPSSRRQRGRP